MSLKEVTDLLLEKLFPLCRSLTGSGNKETFKILKKYLPKLKENILRSGESVFDWTIPPEWNYVGKLVCL